MKQLQNIAKDFIIMAIVMTISIPVVSHAQGNAYGLNKNEKLNKGKPAVEAVAEKENALGEKDALEAEKDGLEAEIEALENELEVAEAGEASADIAEVIRTKKSEMDELKMAMKEKILEAKAAIRASYTEEELAEIEEMRESLALRFKNARFLPVESIMARGRNMKFDTPPVIKDGRTLIPVRAVSEAFGANVAWDPMQRTVTIVRGETEIVLGIDSMEAMVNGEQAPLDVPPEIMGGRTVVPLRFVLEKMGWECKWDGENIEIIEEETDAEDDSAEEPEDGTEDDSQKEPEDPEDAEEDENAADTKADEGQEI
ncbi:MAG TPA: stalk domain-containing protein [Clostridia bacterium]|nr:stalk domain-containing protein [Clostridia bacterium]